MGFTKEVLATQATMKNALRGYLDDPPYRSVLIAESDKAYDTALTGLKANVSAEDYQVYKSLCYIISIEMLEDLCMGALAYSKLY